MPPAVAHQMLGKQDRRQYQRVDLDLLGRFMLESRAEYPCRVKNMSPGDIAVLAAVKPAAGERIIFYVDHVGRLEGTATRVFQGGFAVGIATTERKREKLAAQLTWFANRNELNLPEDRRHERVQPRNPFIEATLEDGRNYQVRIIDLSLSGAALQSAIRPAIGSRIVLGQMQGRVVRHLDEGFAMEFATVQLRDTLEKL